MSPRRNLYSHRGSSTNEEIDTSAISIHSFPPELILKIFIFVMKIRRNRPLSITTDDIFTPRTDPTALLCLSRVCKRWREICLENGHLWASAIEVDYDQPLWVEEFIRRAKTAPLVIRSEDDCPGQDFTSTAWRHAFVHIGNWKTFEIRLSVRADNQPLVEALAQPAPKLEGFQMHNTYHVFDMGTRPKLILSHDLFAGQRPPQLRKFSIANVFLSPSFNFSLWKNLTSLTISFLQYLTDTSSCFAVSAQKWLEILSETTQLEYLHICWINDAEIPLPVNSKIDSVPDVHLDHLLRLDLTSHCEGSILSNVFSKLIIPGKCRTSINFEVDGDQEISEASFERLMVGVNRIAGNWRALGLPLLLELKSLDDSEHNFEISALDVFNPDQPFGGCLESGFFVFACRHDGDWSPFSIMLNALKRMPAYSEFEELWLNLPLRLQHEEKASLHNFLLGLKVTSANIYFVDLEILDVLVSGVIFDQSSKSYPRGEVSAIVLPNLACLAGLVLPQDFEFVKAYVSWRNLHGKLLKSFEVEVTESFD